MLAEDFALLIGEKTTTTVSHMREGFCSKAFWVLLLHDSALFIFKEDNWLLYQMTFMADFYYQTQISQLINRMAMD